MLQELNSGEILIYKTEDGATRIEVRMQRVVKLDDFLKLSEREILTHAGKITHQQAVDNANAEYHKYQELGLNEKSVVEKHFERQLQV